MESLAENRSLLYALAGAGGFVVMLALGNASLQIIHDRLRELPNNGDFLKNVLFFVFHKGPRIHFVTRVSDPDLVFLP